MSETGFYSLKAELPGGKVYDFADLKGKTVLIVNVASKWCAHSQSPNLLIYNPLVSGFTPQYKGANVSYTN